MMWLKCSFIYHMGVQPIHDDHSKAMGTTIVVPEIRFGESVCHLFPRKGTRNGIRVVGEGKGMAMPGQRSSLLFEAHLFSWILPLNLQTTTSI